MLDAVPGRRRDHIRPRPATSTPRPATSTPPAASPACGRAAPGRRPSGRPGPRCAWPRGGASRPRPCSTRRPTSLPVRGTPSPSTAAAAGVGGRAGCQRPCSCNAHARERFGNAPSVHLHRRSARIRRGRSGGEQVVEAIRAGARRCNPTRRRRTNRTDLRGGLGSGGPPNRAPPRPRRVRPSRRRGVLRRRHHRPMRRRRRDHGVVSLTGARPARSATQRRDEADARRRTGRRSWSIGRRPLGVDHVTCLDLGDGRLPAPPWTRSQRPCAR